MDCTESWNCPDADTRFSNWIILSENQTMNRAMVGNWFQSGKTTVFGIVLSVWIVLVNVIVCVSIFAVKRRTGLTGSGIGLTGNGTGFIKWHCRTTTDINRSTSWLAVNFSFVQLVIGVVIIPVTLVTESKGVWSFGHLPCRFWLMAQIFLVANTFWSLAALTIDQLLYQMSPEYHEKLTARRLSMVTLVTFVWGLSGLALVPLWTSFARKDFVLEEVCAVSMTKYDAVAFLLSAFLCPGSAIVVGGVAMLAAEVYTAVRRRRRRRRRRRNMAAVNVKTFDVETQMSPQSEPRSAMTSAAADSIMAAIFFVDVCSLITWAPSFVVNTLVPFCDGMCVDPGLWTFFLWLGYANAGLAPTMWVIDRAIRARIGSLFRAIGCRGSPETGEDELRTKNATVATAGFLLPGRCDCAMLSRSVDAVLWDDDDERFRFFGGSEPTVATAALQKHAY